MQWCDFEKRGRKWGENVAGFVSCLQWKLAELSLLQSNGCHMSITVKRTDMMRMSVETTAILALSVRLATLRLQRAWL